MAKLELNRDVEILHHPDGAIPPQIVGLALLPDVKATDAFRHMDAHVSKRTLPKYWRGAATLLSAQQQLLSLNPNSHGVWDEPELVVSLWTDVFKGLGLEPKWSSRDGCFHMVVADEEFDGINVALCGLFTMYQSAMDRHLYPEVKNPIGSTITVNRPGRRAAKALFRVKRAKAKTLRTQIPAIVERIRRAGRSAKRPWPPGVTMLVDLMIEGLARLSEQIALTVKDWWDASEFGDRVNTPNKGDNYARTKVQIMSAAYLARLKWYFDNQRIDRNHRSLDDYRRLAEGGDLDALEAEAIFTNAKGLHFSQSGVADYYFRPAMVKAGLEGVSSHAIRHAGVCAFFAWLKAQDISQEEKKALKILFGEYMGWKWPEGMMDYYGAAERREQAVIVAIEFLQARRIQLDELMLAGDLISVNDDDPPDLVTEHKDQDLARLFALEDADPAEAKEAA